MIRKSLHLRFVDRWQPLRILYFLDFVESLRRRLLASASTKLPLLPLPTMKMNVPYLAYLMLEIKPKGLKVYINPRKSGLS